MCRIKIKNFGPIKEGFTTDDGWMDIRKVTVFVGNQGSGKSTVAKLISTLSWIEKAINRGDLTMSELTGDSFTELFEYQRIRSYFKENTLIEYIGDRLSLKFDSKSAMLNLDFNEESPYIVPKVMYIPSERNFLSVIQSAFTLSNLPETLADFGEELKRGQLKQNNKFLELPINQLRYVYSKERDISYLVGWDHKINLLEASSGLQSLVPLYIVVNSLHQEILQGVENLSISQRLRQEQEISEVSKNHDGGPIVDLLDKIGLITAKYRNKCIVNVVEEPEQNLFPESQWEILKKLLGYNNEFEGNKLIMTTHSPYVINYLSIAIQGEYLMGKIRETGRDANLLPKLNELIPIASLVSQNDVVIYELDEKTGTITKLPTYEGIPSDQNFLNGSLAQGNELFDALLEIEQEL